MNKVQTNDKVIVIAGKHKGAIGNVVAISGDRIVVKGVNIVKKAVKGQGFVEKEAPMNISNIMPYDEKEKTASKIGIKDEKGKKVRYYKKTGNVLA